MGFPDIQATAQAFPYRKTDISGCAARRGADYHWRASSINLAATSAPFRPYTPAAASLSSKASDCREMVTRMVLLFEVLPGFGICHNYG